jgi:hypothetical protein
MLMLRFVNIAKSNIFLFIQTMFPSCARQRCLLRRRICEVLACWVEPCHLPQHARACQSTSTCTMPVACFALSVQTAYSIRHLAKHISSQQFSTFAWYHCFQGMWLFCLCTHSWNIHICTWRSRHTQTVGTFIFRHMASHIFGDPVCSYRLCFLRVRDNDACCNELLKC